MNEPMVIPHCELSPEALRGILEEFVTRGGVEHGEISVEERVAQLESQLRRGKVRIYFDPESGLTNLA